MANMTLKQYQEITGQRHKYNNKPVVVDGVRYDSKKEYARWCELQILQKAGEIESLVRQKKEVLRSRRCKAMRIRVGDKVLIRLDPNEQIESSREMWAFQGTEARVSRRKTMPYGRNRNLDKENRRTLYYELEGVNSKMGMPYGFLESQLVPLGEERREA